MQHIKTSNYGVLSSTENSSPAIDWDTISLWWVSRCLHLLAALWWFFFQLFSSTRTSISNWSQMRNWMTDFPNFFFLNTVWAYRILLDSHLFQKKIIFYEDEDPEFESESTWPSWHPFGFVSAASEWQKFFFSRNYSG